MTLPTTQRLLLAGGLLWSPALVLAQSGSLEAARVAEHAPMRHPQMGVVAAMVLFVIAIAAIAMISRIFREKSRYDLIARFVDKGQEIPPSLLPQPPSRQRELRRGVWLMGLGLGIGLVLFIASGNLRVAAWCLILLFLGAASFLNAVLFYTDPDSRR